MAAAKDRSNFKPHDCFAERHKPETKHRGDLVDRTCLAHGCSVKFEAPRFGNRLCEHHRKQND